MATLSDFRLRVSAKLGLDNEPAGDQPLIDSWLNEGVAEILTRSRINVVSANMSMTPGVYDYTLSTSMLALDEIFVTDASTSVMYRMQRQSPEQILNLRIGTQNQGAPPVRWYALNGTSLFMVYPTPANADTLTVYYVPRPATLVSPTDTPTDIPVEWHKTIEYYALWQAGQYMNDAPSQSGNLFQQLYEKEVMLMKKAALHRGGRKLSPAVVGRRLGRTVAIGQPSQQEV